MIRLLGRGLPIAVWAGLLSAAPVLAVTAVTAALLLLAGRLDGPTTASLGLGAAAGIGLCCVAVALAARLAAALHELRLDAVQRLRDPAAPVTRSRGRRAVTRASSEVGELARVLDALHLRVRVSDEVGERHRLDAQTAGAGVFGLLSGLVAAEEGARGQLAAELHDTVAQSLMLARGLLTGPPGADGAAVADLVEDAEEQVRAVMARTRPPALQSGDLASAVALLRDDLLQRYGLVVRLEWPAQPHPLPLASAITVYRFLQEALLNVVKHADVDQALASLRITDDAVHVVVHDDGTGFDPELVRAVHGRHVGLDLLRERARLSGGSVTVQSGAGHAQARGTTLTLRLARTPVLPTIPRQGGERLIDS